MEEAVAGTSTVAPLEGTESIDVDNHITNVNPIGAAFDPRTPNSVELLTSITCNPNRSPRDKSIRDMVNKEDAFNDGYDSDGEMGPFYNRTDKEGQQLFNEDDDDGVGFVAEIAIVDERGVGADTDGADDEVHVPIDSETLNGMNLVQLKNELKLRQQSVSGPKLILKKRLIEALDKKLPKHTDESLAKKKAAVTEAKKRIQHKACLLFQKKLFGKN
jgi:hypothetical protein